ncbi:hypothetical protein [Nonomuraea jabiensis]|uniref:hypothetical protein n=1 Tax=Nonomuraea jabiensis TaxID=882448 RepID=UPI003D743CF4
MNAPPAGNDAEAACASTAASRVLPTPPGPTRHTGAACDSAASASCRSCRRPMKDVWLTGIPSTCPGLAEGDGWGPLRATRAALLATPYLRSSEET